MQRDILDTLSKLRERKVGILSHEGGIKAAVLIPLLFKKEGISVIFERRAVHLKRQPGDICFPGGRKEAGDRSLQQTAVRETCEELGIEAGDIEILAPLDILVTHYHAHVYPFVGKINHETQLVPDPNEVDQLLIIPLSFFLETKPSRYDIKLNVEPPDDFPYHLIVNGRRYQWRQSYVPEYFYQYKGHTIWGMTARIMVHFIQLLTENEKIRSRIP